MRAWWESLQTRDRRVLQFGAAALLIAGAYVFFYEPLQVSRESISVRVQAQRDLLQYLEKTAAEVQALGASGPGTVNRFAQQSMLSVIDQTSRSADIKKAMKRLTPVSDRKVRVWFEGVAFDRLATWLIGLGRDSDLMVEDINVSPEDQAGLVRVNLTLMRSS